LRLGMDPPQLGDSALDLRDFIRKVP
jgi:hypothetical protein